MRKFILVLFFSVASNNAMAEWVEDGHSDSMTVYVDRSTIRRTGNMATMWILNDYEKSPELGEGFRRSVKVQMEFDCTEEKARYLYSVNYFGNMGSGDVLHKNASTSLWEPAVPRSISQSLWKIACHKE